MSRGPSRVVALAQIIGEYAVSVEFSVPFVDSGRRRGLVARMNAAAIRSPDTAAEIKRLRLENEGLTRELRALRVQISELERLADSDTLTPLLNRRAFLREVDRSIARVARHGTPVAVMIADLDGLKAINDGAGHQAGDAALIHVGYALKAMVRATDIVARIGGDEFGLVLEDLDAGSAEAKALMLASGIAAEPIEGMPVSVSIGYALITADDTIDSIIARADAAMYVRKRAQRSAR
jgi:diguanylate cyclase (GGDEF)-like protein